MRDSTHRDDEVAGRHDRRGGVPGFGGFEHDAGSGSGILRYEFGSDLGLGDSNFDFALVADFASLDDYEAYSSHPEHIAVIQQAIRPIVAEAQRVQYEI